MASRAAAVASTPGRELYDHGCAQGAIIEGPACVAWLTRPDQSQADPKWTANLDHASDAQFVVISQDCDICAASATEPYVEVVLTHMTSEKVKIFAARKGNSSRSFLLEELPDGRARVADARRRMLIAKAALRSATFRSVLRDEAARDGFATWVAARYNRPAIADPIVAAVVRPIQKGLEVLAESPSAMLSLFKRVVELRFSCSPADPPWNVVLTAILEPGDTLVAEQEADVSGWVADQLRGGSIAEVRVVFIDLRQISVHDYLQTERLSLDYVTPEAA